jgi:hypothetical protein
MISKPLFRCGDQFTVGTLRRYIYHVLTKPDDGIGVGSDMEEFVGQSCEVTTVCDLMFADDGWVHYRLDRLRYNWTDEMSAEGQRLFRCLIPMGDAQFEAMRLLERRER